MMQSENLNEFFAALAKAQADMPVVVKDNKVNAGSIRYSYADMAAVLATCLPRIAAQQLCLTQRPGLDADGNLVLRTTLGHSSGQWMASDYPIRSTRPDAQSVGSAITYARRYAAMAILGIAADDDDGAAASQPGAGHGANDPDHREVRRPYRSDGVPRGTRAQKRQMPESRGHQAPSQLYEEVMETIDAATNSADLTTAADLAKQLEDAAEKENARQAYAVKVGQLGFGATSQAANSPSKKLTRRVIQGSETA